MAYQKTNWEDLPSKNTPINAANLNKIENELENLDKLSTYSTNETKIGTWIDGKPLYKKTFSFNELQSDGNEHFYDLGIANIKSVTNLYGTYQFSQEDIYVPINFYNFLTKEGTYMFVSNISSTGCRITYNSNLSSTLIYITVEYTKTTD